MLILLETHKHCPMQRYNKYCKVRFVKKPSYKRNWSKQWLFHQKIFSIWEQNRSKTWIDFQFFYWRFDVFNDDIATYAPIFVKKRDGFVVVFYRDSIWNQHRWSKYQNISKKYHAEMLISTLKLLILERIKTIWQKFFLLLHNKCYNPSIAFSCIEVHIFATNLLVCSSVN